LIQPDGRIPGPVVHGLKRNCSVCSAVRGDPMVRVASGWEDPKEPAVRSWNWSPAVVAASSSARALPWRRPTVSGDGPLSGGFDQQHHDPLLAVAELVRQGAGEGPAQEAGGREQQAAQERPVDGAGQQQVLVGAGTVDVGKLDGDAERIR